MGEGTSGGGYKTPAENVLSTMVPAEIQTFLKTHGLTDTVVDLADKDIKNFPSAAGNEIITRARTKATIASVILQESEHVTSDQDKEEFERMRKLAFADIRQDIQEENASRGKEK